jgi:hypothetical protein
MNKERKTHIVGTRVTKKEYKLLLNACSKYQMTMSKVLHIIIGDYFNAEKKG